MKTVNGFTLIELLIVVAIIGILAAIAVPNFIHAQIRAKVAQAHSNMRSISTALESYFIDYNSYTQWASVENEWRGMYQLTTPISYINSSNAFRSPFPFKQAPAGSAAIGLQESMADYFELSTWMQKANSQFGSNYPFNVYLLESAGPNQEDDYNRGIFPREGLVYHASNGITSDGNLYRAGGVFEPSWISES